MLSSKKFLKKIIKATQPFGYYSPSVHLTKDTENSKCWEITLDVEPGLPVIIRNKKLLLNGDGRSSKDFKKLIDQSSLVIGQVLVDQDYEALKSNLAELASEQGFLDAKFLENKIDVYPDELAADILLHFDTGVRYVIDRVNVIQTPYFLDSQFIENLLTIQPDEYVSNSALYDVRKKLAASGYFDQISIAVDMVNRKSGRVPITVTLTPGDRIKYSAGIGFSTDAGARLNLEYKNDRINDFGYQFNSKLSLSNVISKFTVDIKTPSKSKPSSRWYNYEAGFRTERTDIVSSDTSKLGISQTNIHRNHWQNVNYIDLVNEKFDTGLAQNESLLLVHGTSWSLIKADNPAFPRKGYKIQADLKGASSSVLSDVSFIQMSINFKGIQAIGTMDRLIYRTQIGTTHTDNIDDLPTSYRYFTGGDNSIRGFSYETLAPLNSDGDVAGGKHIAVASIEYEHHLADQWAWAVFSDVGNAFNDHFQIEKSVGTGLRWFSPVGPVRLDIGVPINNNENDFKIHITLGSDF